MREFIVVTVLPSELISGELGSEEISKEGKKRIDSIFQNNLIPITFGYVNLIGNKSFIISGDRIALALVRSLSAEGTVFVMDVDGVFKTSDLRGTVVRQITDDESDVQSSLRGYDVTGGIRAKISVGFESLKTWIRGLLCQRNKKE